MNSSETQWAAQHEAHVSKPSRDKDIKTVKDTGPYALLTQEELISLVHKQESQLLEKSKKISELEQYIDNLLVRVIEEAPNILMTMAPLK
uniref:FIP-RBD domain-containing protein n=1 Tax=Periophthalmus magnuspinnatus TaxID=409849 RepID=A0A3B4AKF4_9GOBI